MINWLNITVFKRILNGLNGFVVWFMLNNF